MTTHAQLDRGTYTDRRAARTDAAEQQRDEMALLVVRKWLAINWAVSELGWLERNGEMSAETRVALAKIALDLQAANAQRADDPHTPEAKL
jgi:hypothetical protein